MLRFFYDIIKPYRFWILLMMQAPICLAIYPILSSYAIKLLIDTFTKQDIISFMELLLPLSLFIGGEIFSDTSGRVSDYAALKSQPYVRKQITLRCYNHISSYQFSFFQNNFSGSITSKIKGIYDGYNYLFTAITNKLTRSLISIFVVSIILATINVKILLMILTFLGVYIPFCLFAYKKLGQITYQCSQDYHKIIGYISDKIANIMAIISFARHEEECNQLEKYYDDNHMKMQQKWFKMNFIISIVQAAIYWIILASIFLYIIHLRNIGKITIGDIAFTISMSFLLTENAYRLTIEMSDFIQKYSDLKSSFSIMQIDNKISINDKEQIVITKPSIEFKNTSFCHKDDDKNVFNDLNLKINAGENIGIIGKSGAGKTSLMNLLLGHFDITSGEVLIDNKNVSQFTSKSIIQNISIIPQDTILFHRSIVENIRYGNPLATNEEVIEAAKNAHIHDFIQTLPYQYNTIVGERGMKLSGGQRQRISIARAILKNAPILILDEATSALDSDTENLIQKSLDYIISQPNKTLIVIAHRLTTLKNMDRIALLQDGKIMKEFTYKQLIEDKNYLEKFKVNSDEQ